MIEKLSYRDFFGYLLKEVDEDHDFYVSFLKHGGDDDDFYFKDLVDKYYCNAHHTYGFFKEIIKEDLDSYICENFDKIFKEKIDKIVDDKIKLLINVENKK